MTCCVEGSKRGARGKRKGRVGISGGENITLVGRGGMLSGSALSFPGRAKSLARAAGPSSRRVGTFSRCPGSNIRRVPRKSRRAGMTSRHAVSFPRRRLANLRRLPTKKCWLNGLSAGRGICSAKRGGRNRYLGAKICRGGANAPAHGCMDRACRGSQRVDVATAHQMKAKLNTSAAILTRRSRVETSDVLGSPVVDVEIDDHHGRGSRLRLPVNALTRSGSCAICPGAARRGQSARAA